MSSCPNCGKEASYAYCAHCGQDQGTLVPSVSEWVGELLDELFFVDRKLPRSLVLLVRCPGELTQEWSAGKRGRYIRPLRLYLAAALVFFLTWSAAGGSGEIVSGVVEGVFAAEADGRSIERGILDAAEANVVNSLPRVLLFLLLPVFALVVAWLFPGKGRKYSESLVFALHVHAFAFLLLSVLSLVNLTGWWLWVEGGSLAMFLLIVSAYLYLAVRRVFGESAWTAALKSFSLILAYSAIFLLCLSGLGIWTVAQGELGL